MFIKGYLLRPSYTCRCLCACQYAYVLKTVVYKGADKKSKYKWPLYRYLYLAPPPATRIKGYDIIQIDLQIVFHKPWDCLPFLGWE